MAANPDIQVNPTYTGSYTQTRDTINTELQGGGAGLTVAVMLTTDLYSFVEEGYVLPAQDFIDKMDDGKVFDDFFPALMLNSTDTDGKIWSIPFQRSTPIMYYNKDIKFNGTQWGLMPPVQGGFHLDFPEFRYRLWSEPVRR